MESVLDLLWAFLRVFGSTPLTWWLPISVPVALAFLCYLAFVDWVVFVIPFLPFGLSVAPWAFTCVFRPVKDFFPSLGPAPPFFPGSPFFSWTPPMGT